MAISQVRSVLVAASAVTALVPADHIEPIRRGQSITLPSVTLQRVSVTPFNGIAGFVSVDANLVQLTVIDDSYTDARSIADACRTALQDGGYLLQSELDGHEPETDPELYEIFQTWSVFT